MVVFKGYLNLSKWLLEDYKNCKSDSDQLLHTIQVNIGYTPLMQPVLSHHLELLVGLPALIRTV